MRDRANAARWMRPNPRPERRGRSFDSSRSERHERMPPDACPGARQRMRGRERSAARWCAWFRDAVRLRRLVATERDCIRVEPLRRAAQSSAATRRDRHRPLTAQARTDAAADAILKRRPCLVRRIAGINGVQRNGLHGLCDRATRTRLTLPSAVRNGEGTDPLVQRDRSP